MFVSLNKGNNKMAVSLGISVDNGGTRNFAPFATDNDNILIVKSSLRHWIQLLNLLISPSPTDLFSK